MDYATEALSLFAFLFFSTKERMNNTANVMRHTVVPIIFCLLKIKAIKIAVKDSDSKYGGVWVPFYMENRFSSVLFAEF